MHSTRISHQPIYFMSIRNMCPTLWKSVPVMKKLITVTQHKGDIPKFYHKCCRCIMYTRLTVSGAEVKGIMGRAWSCCVMLCCSVTQQKSSRLIVLIWNLFWLHFCIALYFLCGLGVLQILLPHSVTQIHIRLQFLQTHWCFKVSFQQNTH